MSLSPDAETRVAVFQDRAEFTLNRELEVVEIVERGTLSADELRHVMDDHLAPAILAERHGMVLHASAVSTSEGVLGFLAPSGFGKSTLASNLARLGAQHVGDDALVIDKRTEGLFARGLKGLIRMRPDVAPGDARVEAHAFGKLCMRIEDLGLPSAGESFLPLRRIYLLQPPDEDEGIRIEPCPARDSFFVLLDQQFRLFKDDPERQAREFERTSDPALLGLCKKLYYPRRLDVFSELWQALRADLTA